MERVATVSLPSSGHGGRSAVVSGFAPRSGEAIAELGSSPGVVAAAVMTLAPVAGRAPSAPSHSSLEARGQTPKPPYRICRVGGGRELAVETFGAPDGIPVIFMHGMPGSRTGPYPRSSSLELQGVRLVAYDRPGYGGSTRDEGCTVASAAADVKAIADDLGLPRFAIAGRSGGGPHALAVAALLPGRVTAAAVLVSAAPSEATDLDWQAGMFHKNIETFSRVKNVQAKEVLRQELSCTARRTMEDPENFLRERVTPGLSELDVPVVEDFEIRRQLRAAYIEALSNGIDGWFDDILALQSRWGFLITDVTVPTLLWHGEKDTFVPVDHVHWLASQIPGSEVTVEQQGHFGAVTVLPRVLSWLVDRHLEAGV